MADFDGAARFNLSLALVDLILREGPLHRDELVERLQISAKEIDRAVAAITLSEDGRQFVSFFELDWPAWEEDQVLDFTPNSNLVSQPILGRHQATALAAGLDYLSSLAMFEKSEALSQLQQLFETSTVPASRIMSKPSDRLVEQLRDSLAAGRRVEFEYVNQGGEKSHRKVDPSRLDFRGGSHYLRGFCLTTESMRSFRLDRISSLAVLDEPVDSTRFANESSTDVFRDVPGGETVKISADLSAREIFANFPINAEPIQSGTNLIGEIRIGNLNHLGRHIARYGGAVVVLEPEAARQVVHNFVLRAMSDEQPD